MKQGGMRHDPPICRCTMPTILLKTIAETPITLPLASQRAVQGMIYRLVQSESARLAQTLHDEGASFERHRFKFFTFSRLRAVHTVDGKLATYTGRGRIEIRTPDPILAQTLESALSKLSEIELLHQFLTLEGVERQDTRIDKTDILIRMQTPLTVHVSDENKFVRFFSPFEADFSQLIAVNYRRKASAFWQEEVQDSIQTEPVQILPRDRCVTSFKGTSICGYYGVYRLRGTARALDFLYQTGLGARNSQGFGMFNLVEG